MSHEVFISYSSKDKTIADAICAKLEENGIRCWYAPRDILPGETYADVIIGAIEKSKIMVLVFTSSSNISRDVLNEVKNAFDANLLIMPFKVEEVPLSRSMKYFTTRFHWLDALTPPMEMNIARLITSVKSVLFPASVPPQSISHVALTGDGRPSSTSVDKILKVWNLEMDQGLKEKEPHSLPVTSPPAPPTTENTDWKLGPNMHTDWHAAVKWASGLGEGWKMPTIDQLQLLASNRKVVEIDGERRKTCWLSQLALQFHEKWTGTWEWLWSSEANDEENAIVCFTDGTIGSRKKTNAHGGRALAVSKVGQTKNK